MSRTIIAAAMLLALMDAASAQQKTSEYVGQGQWTDVATTTASTQPSAAAELDRVEAMIREGKNRSAAKVAVEWLKANKSHPH